MWGPLHSQAGVPLREEERPTVLLVITIVLLVITINVGDDIYPFSVARSACGFVGRRLKDQAGLPTCFLFICLWRHTLGFIVVSDNSTGG